MSYTSTLDKEADESRVSGNEVDMCSRVYVLLSISDGKTVQAAQAVRDMPGVMFADLLDGDPNLLLMIEAPDRLGLAELLMPALSVLDGVTEDMRLLLTSTI